MKLLLFLVLLIGCGQDLDPQQSQKNQQNQKDEKGEEKSLSVVSEPITINGYVSPMNVSVDGVEYVDSEDFYTQEIERLSDLAKEQYPEHKLIVDAEVGLKDLKRDLIVYLAASNDEGFADETPVNGKGQFTFSIPAKVDSKQSYLLRAYKRIGLRLERNKEVISWCYNFFAEKEVVLEKDKSLILRDFSTKITKYKCSVQKSSGISLPYPDMPGVPVSEAFENAETWPGYGPAPKQKDRSEAPQIDPGEESISEDEESVSDESQQKLDQAAEVVEEISQDGAE